MVTCALDNALPGPASDVAGIIPGDPPLPRGEITVSGGSPGMIPATSLAGAGSALSRAQGKDIRWDARGIDTELDRGVLHQLADSLLHLVRNAVDHGVEPMAEREAAGKQRQGTIRLHAMQLGSEVIVAITDDGNGIDLDEILVVIEKNLRPLSFTPGMRRDPAPACRRGRGSDLSLIHI